MKRDRMHQAGTGRRNMRGEKKREYTSEAEAVTQSQICW